jgi:tRNA-2-methylthio-N6-dimethylallyladenosine synthase
MRIYVETYGCQMNEYDSRMIREILARAGHTFVAHPSRADAIVVNTCAVRGHAESRALGRLSHLRGLAPRAVLGAVGCVAQERGYDLLRRVRGLDFVVGTDRYALLPDVIENAARGGRRAAVDPDASVDYDDRPAPTSAGLCEFVSVTRGCGNYCSYCIVPLVRGPERCRPAASVVREARALADRGAREITLIGQNVNSYSDGPTDFAGLLGLVHEIEGLARIRFATSHPKDLSDDLIEAVAALPKVCEHVHLPVQSGSDRILRAMNRTYAREGYLRLVDRIRSRVPGVAVTTDVIVGFPGESDEDYAATLDLMERVRFDSAFMFRYSPREGTAAARLADDVPERVKIDRLTAVIELQKRLTSEINASRVGGAVEMLVEGPSERDGDSLFGRTRTGTAVVVSGAVAAPGALVQVRIARATAWTLHAEPLGRPAVDERPRGEKDLAAQ